VHGVQVVPFLQRVGRQQHAHACQRRGPGPGSLVPGGGLRQGLRLQCLQASTLLRQPLLPGLGVVQLQAVGRRSAPQRQCGFGLAGIDGGLEALRGDLDRRAYRQPIAVGLDQTGGARLAQPRQLAAQVAPCAALVEQRPEQRDDALARQRAFACQQHQQRLALPDRQRQRLATLAQLEGPEPVDGIHASMMPAWRQGPRGSRAPAAPALGTNPSASHHSSSAERTALRNIS
jgi:hypothetical protein